MDEWLDVCVHAWKEGRKEGSTEERKEGRKEGRKEERKEERKGWMDGRKEGSVNHVPIVEQAKMLQMLSKYHKIWIAA